MLSEFKHLPGQYVVKEDGNLRVIETVPGDVTLVIGTAPSGPSGLHLVTDTASAESLFDPLNTKTGTLLKQMYETIASGAKYLALYRVGASSVAVDFVNGYTIIVNDSSVNAGTKYKLFYTNNDITGSEIIRIYDTSSGSILFDSAAGIDNGQVTVIGQTLFTASQSSIVIGWDFADGSGNPTWQNSPSLSALKDFTSYGFVSFAGTPGAVKETSVVLNATTKTAVASNLYYKAGQILHVTSLLASTNDGYYMIDYVIDNGDGTFDLNFSKKLSYSAGVVSELSWTGFTAATDAEADMTLRAIDASDGLSMTEDEKFLAYARAYWELEAAKVDMVVPADVYLDTKNVVDNEGRYKADQAGYIQPTGDFLSKAYEFEHEGNIYMSFKSSFANAADNVSDVASTPYELGLDGYAAKAWNAGTFQIDTAAVMASQADITAATDDIFYNEANFAYQLAAYLDGLSTNDNEASGVIGVVAPSNFSKSGVSKWIGKSPIKNANGVIVKSGSGLLGNKFMAGSLGVLEGFFRTSNGYPDSSPVLYKNKKIDIGRTIDVVGMPLIVRTGYDGTSTGYVTSANGIYGGTIMSFEPNVPATKKAIKSSVSLPISPAKKYLNALVASKYVVFNSVGANIKVVDAPTAALSTSDYNRRSTNRVVSAIVEMVRNIAEPYMGFITSSAILAALEDEINNRLIDLQAIENQYILSGNATVRQTADMRIKGEGTLRLSLVTANELRRLTIYLALAK